MSLKKIYRFYLNGIETFFKRQHYLKMFVAERYALYRKRGLTKKVKWNKKQQKEFDQYWKKAYKKITSKGHKLIESFNGIHHVQYIPDFLFATKIEYKMNPYLYARLYSDKAITEVLYKNKSCALLPETYLVNAAGVFYDTERNVISIHKAKEILLGIREAVIKPTVGSNSGKGIIIGSFDTKGYCKEHDLDITSLLDDSENYMVQELIEQSDSLNKLYSHSINTFRAISYIVDGKVNVAPLSLRIGVGGKKVDNIHSGGLGIGVNEESETLLKNAYQLGYSDTCELFERHPDTQTAFENYTIPGIKKIIKAAIDLHGHTPGLGIISWDFTLNENDTPILIEANYVGQAVWLSQIVNQKPIFGNHTSAILKQIR